MKRLKRKDLLLLTFKLTEKIPDLSNEHYQSEHYQSLLKKKNRKSVKESEIFTYQPNTFEKPNNVDIKSVITKHPKTS